MNGLFVFFAFVFLSGFALMLLNTDKRIERRKLTFQDQKLLEQKLKRMDPRQFEYFCTDLFKQLGYEAYTTQATADGGKDIVLKKKRKVTYVECKHFSEFSTVGRPIANKLFGVMKADKADEGIIITTGQFTKDCLEFCKKVGIKCIGFNDIISLCMKNIGTDKALEIAGIHKELREVV